MEQTIISKNKTFGKFKNGFSYLDKGAIVKMIFWIIFLLAMIYFTVRFITEKTGFNSYIIKGGETGDSDFFVGCPIQ
jgi:hypothetical protein